MRILLAQDSYLPALGGAELHVHHLAHGLVRLGHEVVVLTATPGPAEDRGIAVIRLPWLAHQGRASTAVLALYGPRLRRLVAGFDVIHGHQTAMVSASIARAASNCGVPFLVTLHGFGTLPSSVGTDRYRLKWRDWCFENADSVVATTPEMRHVAEEFVDTERIVDITNGVDTTLFQEGMGAPVPYHLMTVRRLVPKNGVQYVVEAMPDVLRVRPEARLTIVGDGYLRARLEARVLELGLASKVTFRGSVPHEDLPPLLATASAIVFASSAEGFSLAALEAMSVGRPVVASAVGGFPLMLGDSERGFLVRIFERSESDYQAPERLEPAAHAALVQAILRALDDSGGAARVARAGADWVREHYDWSAIAAQVDSEYRRLVRDRASL